MAHLRTLIRDNVIATLTGLSLTGSNVFKSKSYPLTGDKLPSIGVFTQGQESDYSTVGSPRSIQHTLNMSIEIYVKGSTGYDDTLDLISEQVEEALYADLERGSYAFDTQVTGFDSSFSVDGEKPIAVGTLSIMIRYRSVEGSQSQ
jgi:hypothetical protein|tara:strand:+ start:2034 stop:2471 length:438 start_codon:yes stop_codon:yes gene_type:complete